MPIKPSNYPRIPLAVICSDLHLSERPPLFRSSEPDWFKAQGRVLKELKALQAKLRVPIVCAGDIFDSWDPSPELINWAISNLPEMYTIPGQHDLPLHRLDDVHKSAYWTLRIAGRIKDLYAGDGMFSRLPSRHNNHDLAVYLYPFPWGIDVHPITHYSEKQAEKRGLHIAVIHRYCWKAGFAFRGADREHSVMSYMDKLTGYDIALFGDNHKGFDYKFGTLTVWNNGAMMRRASDQMDYQPRVGIAYSTGEVENHPLPIDQDVVMSTLTEDKGEPINEKSLKDFVKMLESMERDPTTFRDTLESFMATRPMTEGTKKILTELVSTS